MKQNYFMVLIALLAFALNANAQEDNNWEAVNAPEDTEVGTEGYNMIITLPDGTTVTINTKDVDEVRFSNGQVTVSGATIQELLTLYYEMGKAYTDQQIAATEMATRMYIQNLLQDYLNNNPDVDLSNFVTRDELQAFLIGGESQSYVTKEELQVFMEAYASRLNALQTDFYNRIYELNDKQAASDAAMRLELSNLAQEVNKNGNSIDDLYARVNDLYNIILDVNTSVNQNQSDIEWIKYFWSQLSGRLDDLQDQINSIKEQ